MKRNSHIKKENGTLILKRNISLKRNTHIKKEHSLKGTLISKRKTHQKDTIWAHVALSHRDIVMGTAFRKSRQTFSFIKNSSRYRCCLLWTFSSITYKEMEPSYFK